MSGTLIDQLILSAPGLGPAADRLADGEPGGAVPLARPAWPWTIVALTRRVERPLVVVAPGDEEARDLAREVSIQLGRAAVGLWPTIGVPARGAVGPSPHLVGQRARARDGLGRTDRVVVTSAAAMAERVPAEPAEPLRLEVGAAIELDAFVDELIEAGYERVPQVEERGEVALRGGILDLYPSTADMPVRVELFGDEVESLRAFSPFTQRTVRPLTRAVAWPARDPAEAVTTAPLDLMGDATLVRLAPSEHDRALTEAVERLEDEAEADELVPSPEVASALEATSRMDLDPPGGRSEPAFDAVEARFTARGMGEAEGELARLARNGRRVMVWFARRGDLERTAALLDRVKATQLKPGQLPEEGAVGFAVGDVRSGFLSRALGLAIIPEGALFRRRRPRAEGRPTPGRVLRSFLDLKVGDYIVHEDHGIGRLTGFETRTVANITRDYLDLAFAGGDRLYVPHDQLHRVSRYVGADGSEPTLSKLGGKGWDKMKSRARASVREMAGELITLYEARANAEGFAFPADDELMAELVRRFAYTETPDQQRAIDAVLDDMERDRPMDRLICGDVGFGKTEIAMRAVFKAATAGKQSMVVVPTTILAQQHLATFRERFDELPVGVDMVNRFRPQSEVKEVLARFRAGELDVLIGTHRLLSMDVTPKDLGLVVVDEEQRFGVAQKEALRQLKLRVDVLAMSATPIPRTLQISLSGIRDISVIETPPSGRRPVATHVGEYDDELVAGALARETARGGQSFVLHNRIETIVEATERVRALAPEARIVMAHGQMPERQLEDVMLGFVRGEADILVSTSIIEAGLDIPRANTLIVERADQLGLSQLYQLRGRVGRSDVTAHAYLLYPDAGALTRDAAARLRALADYTELGSGLRIAMRDLEIRGAGNLLGDEQSGQVAAVGFELYVEMLQEAIALREGGTPPEAEPRVDIPVSAFIPAEYIPLEAAKIDIHRRIAQAQDLAAVVALAEELEDRFGPVPDTVTALLALQRLRIKMRAAGASAASAKAARIVLAPIRLNSAELRRLREDVPRLTYQSAEAAITVTAEGVPPDRLAAAERALDALAETRAATV